jgi:hypothetical protein
VCQSRTSPTLFHQTHLSLMCLTILLALSRCLLQQRPRVLVLAWLLLQCSRVVFQQLLPGCLPKVSELFARFPFLAKNLALFVMLDVFWGDQNSSAPLSNRSSIYFFVIRLSIQNSRDFFKSFTPFCVDTLVELRSFSPPLRAWRIFLISMLMAWLKSHKFDAGGSTFNPT